MGNEGEVLGRGGPVGGGGGVQVPLNPSPPHPLTSCWPLVGSAEC